MKNLILVLIILFSTQSFAKVIQDEQVWANLNTFINLKNDWQVYLEIQPRFIDYHSKLGTTLYRGAVGKSVGKGFSLWAGYGFIERTNPNYFHEDRPFLQAMHAFDPGVNFRIINRTRFEGRYFRGMTSPAWRLRHLLRGQYRLTGSKFGIVLYDEWFWNSASHIESGIKEGFDQNRIFAGISYLLGEKEQHMAEIGYMNQYVNGAVNDQSNDILAMQFTFRY